MRIVVTGLIGSIPLAGLTLHYLQYVLGLKQLGHDVLYLEDTGTWCYDPSSDGMVEDSSSGVEYLAHIMRNFADTESWTFIDHQQKTYGVSGKKFKSFISSADMLINVTGAGLIREDYERIPARVYVDTDPGFIQLRLANDNTQDRYHLGLHNAHFSFGCNIGLNKCLIPEGGFTWRPTRQPICMDLWPQTPADRHAPLTTIMKWKSYSPEKYDGETYGLKDLELMKFIRLPELARRPLELAISGDPPQAKLEKTGWRVRPAFTISRSIDVYRKYIQDSSGEWSIAKNAYVSTYSGWFSERSACYLASGRPTVLQETGFSEWLDTSSRLGVIPFTSADDALEAVTQFSSNYQKNCEVAREMAHEYFSAGKVLQNLLENV